ncbi:MAG TPA: metalloregulator ArsR/SmtB family transcription factor [Acidimicrobiales bacterium]|nr:metalloregulator ArsR/SmtB family transcription factor [Acidimicrobiales bacterium]
MPMLMEEARTGPTPSVTAAPSLASDLSWLLSVAARPALQARYPQLAGIFDGRADLVARVQEFWGDGAVESCFTEMQILAAQEGALTGTDPDALWEAIARAVPTASLELDLPSETPEDIALYVNRLRRLQESPELLASYLQLLRDVWTPVDAVWQQAVPIIEEAGRQALARYERAGSLQSLVPSGCDIFDARIPSIGADLADGQLALLFVPCLFFGTSMYLEFPGLVVVGTGVGQNDVVARARTESVARRLKAVADPTRLAILHTLATAPSTVGDLALLFRLAQPTVSMHVKVLRENGLIRSERRAGRLQLSADPEAVESLLGELRLAVLHGGSAGAPLESVSQS